MYIAFTNLNETTRTMPKIVYRIVRVDAYQYRRKYVLKDEPRKSKTPKTKKR